MKECLYLTGVLRELQGLLREEFEHFHFLVFSSPEGGLPRLQEREKTVVLYLSNESGEVPLALCSQVRAVFKAYLPAENLAPNLHSLPLGYAANVPELACTPVLERPLSVSFSGCLNRRRLSMLWRLSRSPWQVFQALVHRLLRKDWQGPGVIERSLLRFTAGFSRGLSGTDYARQLDQSQFALCPGGFISNETYRHYEAMRAGAICVGPALPPLRFYTGSPLLKTESWSQLPGLLSNLLGQPERLQQLQADTRSWWRERCSEAATARYMASVLQ